MNDTQAPTPDNNNHRRSWNFSLEAVKNGNKHSTPERAELLEWVFTWCTSNRIPRDAIAEVTGYDTTKVYQIFVGKYIKPSTGKPYDIPEKFHEALRGWKLTQLAGALEEGQDGIEWVDTSISKRVWEAHDLARESRSPVFIYGASHIGKTQATWRWVTNHNHGNAVHFRMPSSGGRKAMLTNICEKLGLGSSGSIDDLVKRIKRNIHGEMTLAFDEMHGLTMVRDPKVFFSCVETLRELWDHAHCGMTFICTNLDKTLFEQERKGALQQISRRGVHVYQLGDEVPEDDVRAIFTRHHIRFPGPTEIVQVGKVSEKPYEVLRQLAKEHGIKAICERVRYAKKMATRSKAELSLAHFVQAHLTIASNAAARKSSWK